MNTYYDDQDDCDEMSGYNKAKRQAARKHESLNYKAGIPLGNWLVAAIVFALIWYLCAGCSKHKAPHPEPNTVVKVFYTNGQSEQLTLVAYPDKIWLDSYRGSSTLQYDDPRSSSIYEIAATEVRRFEIVSSNYKQHAN